MMSISLIDPSHFHQRQAHFDTLRLAFAVPSANGLLGMQNDLLFRVAESEVVDALGTEIAPLASRIRPPAHAA